MARCMAGVIVGTRGVMGLVFRIAYVLGFTAAYVEECVDGKPHQTLVYLCKCKTRLT